MKIPLFVVAVLGCVAFASVSLALAQEEFTYDSGGKYDPFTPWVTPDGRLQILQNQDASESHDLQVEGIIYDKRGLSYAIINGAIVKIGDTVDSYEVLTIEEQKVILIRDGQPREVVLKEEGI